MTKLNLGKVFFIAAFVVSVSPLLVFFGVQQIVNTGPFSLPTAVPLLLFASMFPNVASTENGMGTILMAVILTAGSLFLLFCVFNLYILYDGYDFRPWKLTVSRIYLYGVTVLSGLHYGTGWSYGLKYQGHSATATSAGITLMWFAACYFWMHRTKQPRNNFQLLIVNSLLFFGIYAVFFPWLGEMP